MSKAGNTNALSHGATTAAARRGEFPKGYGYLSPIVEDFYLGWIADLGGESEVSKQEEALLFSSRACLVVILLALEHIKCQGFTDAHRNPQSVLKLLASFMNALRLNLTAVGLKRRARETESSLDVYLNKKYGGTEPPKNPSARASVRR